MKTLPAALLWVVLATKTFSGSSQVLRQIPPAPSGPSNTKAFVHPGLAQSRQDLEFVRQKVRSGEQPWKSAFERLQKDASLEYQTKPFTHVIRGGYGRPAIGSSELSAGADAAYRFALLWYLTGEKAYARKAIDILNAWSPVLWDFDDNDAKLLAAWTGHTFCNAAEILRYTDSGWAAKDVQQFRKLLLGVYYPLIKDFFPEANGNWDGAMINTMLCIGIFCDDRTIFDRAVNHFLRGPGNAGITKYVYPSGQCQETTRDQPHVQLGLGEFTQACQVAWTQGVDLFGTAGNRLALGLEYTAKYMLGETVPVYGIASPKGRGRFSDIYEPALQHYKTVRGLDLPYTTRAVDSTRRTSTVGLLTSGRAPIPANGPRPAAGSPRPLLVAGRIPAAQAGAQPQSTGKAPAGATLVAPGESIQAALDARADSGGWVVLAKGLHTLPGTLRIPSGVTLAGQGTETVLLLDPKPRVETDRIALINGADDLHDVTIRDLVIEGAITSSTSSDPNQDRRHRASQMAPRRGGILFSAQRDGQMRNLRFEHLTVRNCTLNGLSVRGAQQVTVVNCDLSDSGGSVVPGHGLFHNLHLTHILGCQVVGNRLDTSPWGSGADITHSRDVVVSNNEAARNTRHGVRVAESQDVRVDGNLIEGNDSSGVFFEKLADGFDRIAIEKNLVQYNGGYGVDVNGAAGGSIRGNALVGNGRKEQLVLVGSENVTR